MVNKGWLRLPDGIIREGAHHWRSLYEIRSGTDHVEDVSCHVLG